LGGFATNDEVHQDAWTINWEHTFGNFQVMAQYGMAGEIKSCSSPTISCDDSDASAWMIGGRYFLSKRTWLFASWNSISNKRNAFADYTGGNQTSVGYGLAPGGTSVTNTTTLVPWGADPEIFAVGIFHQF
jgi:predicted porin